MEATQIVYYALLGLFVISAFFGFLFGLGRGFTKATLRLVFFAAFSIIGIVITPYVSTLLLDFPIEYGPVNGTMTEIINDFIANNELATSIISNSEVLQQFVAKLPLLIINLVVFLILLFTLSSFSWIVYAIFAAIFVRKPKQPVKPKDTKLHVDFKPTKPNKHRFFGGLIGAIHSLLFLALMLVPLTGFLSIASNIVYSTEGNIAYADNGIMTPTAALIDEYLPQEAKDILQVYCTSPIAYLSHYSGADTVVFDSLTTVKIDNGDEVLYISYRGELYSVAKLYDNVEFLIDYDFENIEFATLDYDKLETAVNTVLSSKLLMTIAPELLDWVVDEINLPEAERHIEIDFPMEYLDTVNTVVDQYRAEGTIYSGLRNDLSSVFGVARAIGESGIADQLMNDQIDIEQIKTIALADDNKIVNDVISNLFDAISLRTLLVGAINVQLDTLTETQDIADPNRIEFEHIDLDSIVWTNVTQDISDIADCLVEMYESVESSFTDDIVQVVSNNPYELLNADTAVLTSNLGTIMSTIQNSALFVNQSGQKVLYNQFMDYLNNTQAAEYVNFDEFKGEGTWATEMNNLNSLLTAFKDSGIITLVVDNIETPENIDVSEIISHLASQASNSKTYTHNIISPILDSLAFRKMMKIGFDYLDELIEQNQEAIGAGVVLGKIQSNAILLEQEKVHVLAFFENVILYADELDISTFGSDPFNAIVNSNLTRLGLALDSIKASALFAEYEEEGISYDGIYVSLIEALSNNATYNQFVDFGVALEEDFSWNSEFSYAQNAIDAMNNIVVNYGGVDKTLIEAIIDGEDLLQIMNVLTDANVDSLITPVVSSRLLGKNIITIVNTMNNAIEDAIGLTIEDLPTSTNITDQTSEITLVIKKLIAIYPQIQGGMDSGDITTMPTQIGTLMNAIKTNALRPTNDGVFEGTYNAIINFFKAEGTFGTKFTYIMDSYVDEADIDWEEILSITVDVNGFMETSTISETLRPRICNIIASMFQGEIYGEITDDIIDILNMFATITSGTDENTVLGYVADAIDILGVSQTTYVNDNLATSGMTEEQLKQDYSTKVDLVLNFFKGLTGIVQFDALIGIEDYSAESAALNQLDVALTIIGEPGATQEDFEDVVVALADSELIMQILEQNNIEIEIDPLYQTVIEDFIDTEFAGDQELIDSLKTILGLVI